MSLGFRFQGVQVFWCSGFRCSGFWGLGFGVRGYTVVFLMKAVWDEIVFGCNCFGEVGFCHGMIVVL